MKEEFDLKDSSLVFYKVKVMKIEEARNIVKWRYDQPYSMYNMSDNAEDIEELMDGSYFSVNTRENELIGYFCYGKNAQVPGGVQAGFYLSEDLLDIGLGIRPDLTGKGNGFDFLNVGLNFGQKQYQPKGFRLSVATFNLRAICLYEKVGFKPVETFLNENADHKTVFLLMEKH